MPARRKCRSETGNPAGSMMWAATSRHAQRRRIVPDVLGDVGLKKCDLHSTKGLVVAMICLDKSPLGADLVHCTQMSR